MKSRQEGVPATRDLLKQIEGVDGLVTRGVRVRWLGRLGASLSTAFFAYLLRYGWSWQLLAPLGGLVVSSAVVTQGRQWIREARQPFRYTYWVDSFEPISKPQDDRLSWALDWIKADLILMLSDRIGRLSLLPQEEVSRDTPERPASHIHIGGVYGSRQKGDGQVTIELMPRVRIGSERCSSTVALAVRFHADELPDLKERRDTYDHILERVYFSVATQIYRQIRRDVDRKIALLPTRYLRATAYFHEAEDYAQSNTLDAFNDAAKLYGKALDLYDRTRVRLPKQPWLQRPLRRTRQAFIPRWRWVAQKLAFCWPRFGQRDVQIGRARTGYAKTLLFRNILANLSGREQENVFEARRYAQDALTGLEKVQDGVPGREEACFEAYLIAALAERWSGDLSTAETHLRKARKIRPTKGDGKVLLPFVEGTIEPRLQRRIRLLRRAVELDPRFEIAQFELAFNHEQLWRSSDQLEPTGSKLVERAYIDVVAQSPANLTAWANLGYVRWLLWDVRRDDVTEVVNPFEIGRRYKEIRDEAFVAELDYGLARVAAELGELEQAYEHYINASGATMAQEATYGYVNYCFDRINEAILHRYERYLANVRRELGKEARKPNGLPERIRNAVAAFALTDWGNACAAYYRRTGEKRYRTKAVKAFNAALKHNPRYVLALQSRAALRLWAGQEEDTKSPGDETKRTHVEYAEKDIRDALEHEPRWLPGVIGHVAALIELASRATGQERSDRLGQVQEMFAELIEKVTIALPETFLEPTELAKITTSRRANEELLSLMNGPAAGALAVYARVQELAAEAGTGVGRLCEYLQKHLLPGELVLLDTLKDRADEAATDARELYECIVGMGVESDPADGFWLRRLVKLDQLPVDKRIELLRVAGRWPGASCATLDLAAQALEAVAPGDDAIKGAKETAAAKRARLDEQAQQHLLDLIEEHLEDGDFGNRELAGRVQRRIGRFLEGSPDDQAELLADVRGRGFPVAYYWAVKGRRAEALSLLELLATTPGECTAAIARSAADHLTGQATELDVALQTRIPIFR